MKQCANNLPIKASQWTRWTWTRAFFRKKSTNFEKQKHIFKCVFNVHTTAILKENGLTRYWIHCLSFNKIHCIVLTTQKTIFCTASVNLSFYIILPGRIWSFSGRFIVWINNHLHHTLTIVNQHVFWLCFKQLKRFHDKCW